MTNPMAKKSTVVQPQSKPKEMKTETGCSVNSVNMSVLFSILSGISAASGSVFGKFVSIYNDEQIIEHYLTRLGLQILCISLMILSNALVWVLFVRALRLSASSLPATITSAAVNYCCSAVFGWLLFGEQTSTFWWIGSSLVIIGVLLINSSAKPEKEVLKLD